MADDPLVVFTPSGRRGRFPRGTPLLRAARQLGVDLDSVCGGRGICTRCQVRPGEGEFAKHGIVSSPDSLAELTSREHRQLATGRLKEGHRLSCQALVAGDLVADVPETSQVHRQIVRKRAAVRDIRIDPLVRPMYVEVPPPDLARPAAHLRRLKQSLREAFGVRVTGADLHVLRKLHATLEAGRYRATAFVREGRHLVDIRPGFRDRAFGLAVDVGSTTLAVHLCDLLSGEVLASLGRMNPQIRFGEDLMSRISFAMMNEGGAADMTGGGARGARRAGRGGGGGGGGGPRRRARSHRRRQPGNAPPPARTRPRAPRLRSLRARDGRGDGADRIGPRPAFERGDAGSTCCRASRATWERMQPGSC